MSETSELIADAYERIEAFKKARLLVDDVASFYRVNTVEKHKEQLKAVRLLHDWTLYQLVRIPDDQESIDVRTTPFYKQLDDLLVYMELINEGNEPYDLLQETAKKFIVLCNGGITYEKNLIQKILDEV